MQPAHARVERHLLRQIARANRRFTLLEPDDHVMVCVSGGKDSWSLLHLLRRYQAIVPFSFSMVAVNLDQGHPGYPVEVVREHLTREGFAHKIVTKDTYSVVQREVPEGKAHCSLCSRLRRGILYDAAEALGATKVALGHHRDDIIETLLLNQLYAGQLKAMAPRLRADDGRNTIIRPLALCGEAELAEYAAACGFPIIPCDLCGSQEGLKRVRVKQLLAALERELPGVRKNLLAAAGNVKPSHLLDAGLTRRDAPGGELIPLANLLDGTGK
ncbi:MAG: tRNA 2-thiocytidine(32) synthetase TtcA [Myxococcales bacterium]|nr:tRNA 2-thiocytidine(32) synthetase TtcA [Myxococcales bacterium]